MDQPNRPNQVSPPGPARDTAQQAIIQALEESPRQILAHDDLQETAEAIYRIVKNLLGAAAGYVALLSPDGRTTIYCCWIPRVALRPGPSPAPAGPGPAGRSV